MMDHVVSEILDIDNMPRGGPDASWLDRRLRTDRLEYLDRDDVDDLKRRAIQALDPGERMLGQHALLAGIALDEATDVPNPKILELGAPPWRHVVQLPFMLPLAMMFPVIHDGYISALGAYSPSALRTLVRYADPPISIEVRRSASDVRGRWQLAVASR